MMTRQDNLQEMENLESTDYIYFDEALCPDCHIRTGIRADEYSAVAKGEKFETLCRKCGKGIPMVNGEPFSQAFLSAYFVIVLFGLIAAVFLTFFLKGSIPYYCGYLFGLFTLLSWLKYSARKSWDRGVLFIVSMSSILAIFIAFKKLI